MEEKDDDSIRWENKKNKGSTEQKYRLSGDMMDFKSFGARLKYQKRHNTEALWDEIIRSDNPEMYKEELRRQRQRRLGRRYHRETAQRLGVIKPLEIKPPAIKLIAKEAEKKLIAIQAEKKIKKKRRSVDCATTTLAPQRQKYQHTRLFNVSIHPCIVRGRRGKDVTGTLEAHLNGFQYSNCCIPFKINIMYRDIKYAFTQDGDEQSAPLCHLHLHKPIMVGTEMTQNIQFRMVQTLEGRKKRPAHGSGNFEKELQKIRDDNNRVMWEFRCKVDCIFDPLPLRLTCDYVDTERGFYGELHLKGHPAFSTIFVFSYFTLVQLNHTPFTIVTLKEIEIVNLVQVGSEMEMFNMTIVFKNFELDVLQINSIPSAKRISIKQSLDLARVKYYENKQDFPDWASKLEEIRANPKEFIDKGGWKFLNVEGSANNSDSSGDEYSIGYYSSEPEAQAEQTCESVPKGKESVPKGKKEFIQFWNQICYLPDSSVENISDLLCSFGFDPNPRKEEKKQTPLVQKTWTMAEGKRVMVSSDECDSDTEMKEKQATTQTKHTTKIRRLRKLVMAEESGDEE
ncbi:hypothetical protein MKW92_002929 [Papaver armeniacum]|nr:hypothetical protein MKW92_002929 [Papaver armeniacum]